ncbi:MAG: cupin domain-containing protein [Alphaproteobacteria bacterium]|nr:cupin domain-containing protein [Alphaproteobacteria bacterium]
MKHVPESAGEWLQCPGYAKKVLLTADDLNCDGGLVQLIEIAPRTSVADHYHDRCTEAFHVVAGGGTFVIDGIEIPLRPGDTLSCQPGEVHSTRNDGAEPFVYVVFKTNAVDGDIHWVD